MKALSTVGIMPNEMATVIASESEVSDTCTQNKKEGRVLHPSLFSFAHPLLYTTVPAGITASLGTTTIPSRM